MPITPRDGKAWCDTVNDLPMKRGDPADLIGMPKLAPAQPTGSYLWLGDYKL